jgi:hypothetical protein
VSNGIDIWVVIIIVVVVLIVVVIIAILATWRGSRTENKDTIPSAVPVKPMTAAYSGGTRPDMSRINGLFAEAGIPRVKKPYPDLERRMRTHLD